jgi:hypothetical protein
MSACLVGINSAAYLHVLHAMMLQVSGISEMCGRTLETRKPSCIGRPVKPFFILKARGPLRVAGHVIALETSRVRRQALKP